MKRMTIGFVSVLLIGLVGCGSGDTQVTDGEDFFVPRDLNLVTDDPFDRNRLSIVQIRMSPADFEALKWEGRSLAEGFSSCPSHDFSYSKYTARVNIDGEVFDDVVIRKKGYLGSLSPSKPSLKLDFDELIEGRLYKTLKRMTLNNNRQDPSHARQCMAYDLYAKAGVNVPRCSWSKVYVNGEEMGVYTHVESIKKPFLDRAFGDDNGNLYESQISDFGTYLNEKFELKTNKTLNDRSDLTAVANALDIEDDAQFLTAIKALVDIPEFISLWAADAVMGNWDSATGNSNNYYLYHHPNDGLFHFIPWGTDAAFTGESLLNPKVGPLYRSNRLANRLFSIHETRTQYLQRLQQLITDHWNEDILEQNLQAIAHLTSSKEEANTSLLRFIKGSESDGVLSYKETLINAINNNGEGQIDYTLEDKALNCESTETSIDANFKSGEFTDTGSFSFTSKDGIDISASLNFAAFETDSLVYRQDNSTHPATNAITLVGADVATLYTDKLAYFLQLSIEDPFYKKGNIKLHGLANSIMLYEVVSKTEFKLIAVSDSGVISLEEAGDGTNNYPIQGTLESKFKHFTR